MLCWRIEEKTVGRFIKKGGKCEMNQPQEKFEGQKTKIITQIAELTQNEMVLSDWLSATRDSFLKLSLLISKELDIQLQ
jgi:hypothetical protein